mmetsp:Transcript_30256/g.55268  ORF Transcript_30256/g.55268 Transcript_30256/m.55268 type:complete len:170 (-) Transcript_30256:1987-2496(-)
MAEPATSAPAEADQATSGMGKFYYHNGATYEGGWKLLIKESVVQVEEPKKGKGKAKDEAPPPPTEPPKRVRHGKGVYREGDYVFEGHFNEDVIQGKGKFTYASGAYYEGQWANNSYNGKGTYVWTDGRKYEGQWVDNKMHGLGVYTDVNGHRWEGQFYNGSGPGLTCEL